MSTHPHHVHPRHKRTAAAAPYRPLFKPLLQNNPGFGELVKVREARISHEVFDDNLTLAQIGAGLDFLNAERLKRFPEEPNAEEFRHLLCQMYLSGQLGVNEFLDELFGGRLTSAHELLEGYALHVVDKT